jgi:hypothetical protein
VLLVPPSTTSSSSVNASGRSELSAYLDSDCVTSYEDGFDILLWWHDHKLTYPVLSIMAKDIMQFLCMLYLHNFVLACLVRLSKNGTGACYLKLLRCGLARRTGS